MVITELLQTLPGPLGALLIVNTPARSHASCSVRWTEETGGSQHVSTASGWLAQSAGQDSLDESPGPHPESPFFGFLIYSM